VGRLPDSWAICFKPKSSTGCEWLSSPLVVFFAFIPFFAVRELRRILGEEVIRIFFQRRSAAEAGCDPPLKRLGK